MRAGQDSDCNPSSAAGVLGVILGYSGIPERWTSGILAIADKKCAYTNYSYNDIVRLSVERAIKVAQGAGGTLTDKEIGMPNQAPRAPKLEQWSMGKSDRAANTTDEAWSWTGAWTDQTASERRYRWALPFDRHSSGRTLMFRNQTLLPWSWRPILPFLALP